MVNAENRRKHSNLYYIFEEDQRGHPMPPEQTEILRRNIFELFWKNVKPNADGIPPLLA